MTIWENGKVREATPEEIKIMQEEPPVEYQIEALKQNLADTDYKAIKYAEGLLTDEEYAETKSLRQQWREEINQLEKEK